MAQVELSNPEIEALAQWHRRRFATFEGCAHLTNLTQDIEYHTQRAEELEALLAASHQLTLPFET